MMFLYSSGYRCYRVSISDCRCCGARVCKKISSWFIYVAAGGSIDYRMLRKEDLSGQEEESYQRQMNKEKIQIRRRERETMFNHKRSNFIPTHFVTLEKMESADGQQRQQANEKSSKGFYKIVDGSIYILDQRYIEQIIQANHYDFPNDIQVHTQLITSDSTLGLICGTVGLRKLLNHTRNIQDIIDAGLVDIIIELMSYAQSKQVQFEATWCIANIAAGTTQQSKILIDGGVVPILLDFIQQNNSGIVQQAIWAIGNLSVDCTQFRNILLESGVGDAISNLLTKEDLGEQFRIECCWTLANLCRGDPLPDFDLVKNSLSVICSMVSMGCIKSIEILVDCCWALSYHYTGRNDRGRDALNFNLLQRIVPIGLQTERSRVVLPIMRILGGLSLGSMEYTQHIIEKGGLDLLEKCIQHDQKMIRREAAYILSNLTATPDLPQIEHILGRDTIMIKMTEMFVHDQEEVRREIAYFFSNMCYGGKELDLVKVFAELQITSCYVELLKSDNHKAIIEGLQSLNHILRLGQTKKSSYKLNILAEQLIHNGGIHIIEGLQQNDEDRIYIGAHSILVSYFSLCDPLGPLGDVDGTIDESTYSDEQQRQQGQVL